VCQERPRHTGPTVYFSRTCTSLGSRSIAAGVIGRKTHPFVNVNVLSVNSISVFNLDYTLWRDAHGPDLITISSTRPPSFRTRMEA
jgi:hypothetical protein